MKSMADLKPYVVKAIKAADGLASADTAPVDAEFQALFDDLVKEYGMSDRTVARYNAAIAVVDEGLTQNLYHILLASHAKVLRTTCQSLRGQQTMMTPAQIDKVARRAFSSGLADCSSIAGIRKSLKVTNNLAVLSQHLTPDEMCDAVMSTCVWAVPVANSVLDAGFVVFYGASKDDPNGKGRKFDIVKGMLVPGTNPDDPSGLMPDEFNLVISQVMEALYSRHSVHDVLSFIEKVLRNLIQHVGLVNFADMIGDYAKTRRLQIPAKDLDEWVQSLLSEKKPREGSGCLTLPANASFDYGLSLLFPLAPMLSRVWIETLHKEKGISKFGFVDPVSLHRGLYNVGGNKYRVLPSASMTFIASADVVASENIAIASKSKTTMAAYDWYALRVKGDVRTTFNLDNVLSGDKIFEAGHTYVLTPRYHETSAVPQENRGKEITEIGDDVDSTTLPDGIAVGDMIAVVFGDKSIAWGKPLSHDLAKQILPRLEFISGQEADASQTGNYLCRVTPKSVGVVAKAVVATRKPCVVLHLAGLK